MRELITIFILIVVSTNSWALDVNAISLVLKQDPSVDYSSFIHSISEQTIKKVTPLKGASGSIRIALDPGHLGGDYSRAEWKFMNNRKHNIFLSEGDLNLKIAEKLENLLKKYDPNIEVFLTRTEPGQSPLGPFHEWVFNDKLVYEPIDSKLLTLPERERGKFFSFYSKRLTDLRLLLEREPGAIFDFFRTDLDNRKVISSILSDIYLYYDRVTRARLVNSFRPDIVVVIHLNSHIGSLNNDFTTNLTDRNFTMSFIPGAFLENELQSVINIKHAARIIQNKRILENSIDLCAKITSYLSEELRIPLATQEDEDYLRINTNPVPEAPGVFSRNLVMTRLIEYPICFTESLYYTNLNEVLAFSSSGSSDARIEQIAKAHFLGILDYFKKL